MILRPYGIVIDGVLELGLELVVDDGVIQEIRPHTGIPEQCVISSAFVNAHSHLEYRGMLGKIAEPDYPSWIREITRLKKLQPPDEILEDCRIAARENVDTGVYAVLEHSDRPFAAQAMREVGLDGFIFQEVITFLEHETPEEKLRLVEDRATESRKSFPNAASLNPHAYQTVDRKTLSYLASLKTPLSIHAAETPFENEFTRNGTGPIADFYRTNNVPFEQTGKSVIASLDDLGPLRSDTQLVHCCALEEGDIELIKERGATVAHCPRSNKRLQCPPAPIREMLDAEISIGLGLDSAASSGLIDMFEEMSCAIRTSIDRGRPITSKEAWRMATMRPTWIGEPFGKSTDSLGAAPLIKIHIQDAESVEDLIEKGHPGLVEWLQKPERASS